VASGQTGGFSLTITPLGGTSAGFSFQCGTLPQYAACTSTPATLNVSAGTSGAETVDVTTSQTTGALNLPARPNSHSGSSKPLAALCGLLALLPLAAFRRFRKALLFVAVLILTTGAFTSCSGSGEGGGNGKGGGGGGGGGGNSTNTTPTGTYTVPVQVTANGVQHSINLTLVVD
jgi:hypothetical protein